MLVNDSDAVWRILSKTGATVTQLDAGSPEFDSFAAFSRIFYAKALMYPHSSVVVTAAPADVSWYIEAGLGASWIIHHRAAQTAQNIGKEMAIDLLSGESLGRKALFTCLDSAYNLAGANLENLTGPDPFTALLEGLGVASSTTSCGAALLKATDDYKLRFGGEVSEWTEDVARWSKDLSFLERSNALLDDAARLVEITVHV